jgi:hypothetical protein
MTVQMAGVMEYRPHVDEAVKQLVDLKLLAVSFDAKGSARVRLTDRGNMIATQLGPGGGRLPFNGLAYQRDCWLLQAIINPMMRIAVDAPMEHAARVFLMCVSLQEPARSQKNAGRDGPEFDSDPKHAMTQHRRLLLNPS